MIQKIKIAERWVGEKEPTLIIVEVGSNHDRKLDRAKELIDIAAESGADVVKFQLFKAETLYPRHNPAFEIIKANELPREWVGELADHAMTRGIMFSASPFDKEAVDQLCEIGAPFLKWASPEIHDLPLLRYAARKGKPMILSTGMCELADIQVAIDCVQSEGNKQIVLLHCTSLYPTEPRYLNLRMMDGLRHAFEMPVGLSDHTMSIVIPAAAVARGACVIEKHFTLSRSLKGPDHACALEPGELKKMVKAIREIEESLGAKMKKPIYGVEDLTLNFKSLIAETHIPKGTRITADMLTVKRSQYGIKPALMDIIVGRRANRDIQQDEIITWDAV